MKGMVSLDSISCRAGAAVLSLVLLVFAPTKVWSGEPLRRPDTLVVAADTPPVAGSMLPIDKVGSRRWVQATYLGVPLIAGRLLEKHYDTEYRRLRSSFLPESHGKFDDYLRLAPAAVMVGLKAAGVPSRSSWGRMLVSDALSTMLMVGMVEAVKHTSSVTRPDGSDNRSFPSGHTATAFMAATMLSKEYGHFSPWVSVGAYTAATATGLMRVANNRHWVSDVMVGAGVGILSTELGYWIADALMHGRGLNVPEVPPEPITDIASPTFLGLYMGFNVPLGRYDMGEGQECRTSAGTTLGIEGAYFFNPYIGMGGRVTLSDLRFIVNDRLAADDRLRFYNFAAGPYFSFPLTPQWCIGSKALLTYTCYRPVDIGTMTVPSGGGLGFGTGLSLGYRMKHSYTISGFADYDLRPSDSEYGRKPMNSLILGFRAEMRF
jgi:membrane-associated phospholipid phosphatase